MMALPHMAPLVAYTQSVAAKMGAGYELPNFDPCDGGVDAEALLLLEAPGRKAMGSGLVSRNNPDPSAKRMCQLLADAAIPRKATLLWNIIPWYIGLDSSIRAVTSVDLAAARPFFAELIALLPNLKAIVLIGRRAQGIAPEIRQLTNVRLFETHHPSQKVMNRWPERHQEMRDAFHNLAFFLHSGTRDLTNISPERSPRRSD